LNTIDQTKYRTDFKLEGSSNEVKSFGTEGQFKIVTKYKYKESSKESRKQVETDVLKALDGFALVNSADTQSPVLQTTSVGASIATETRNKSAFLVILTIVGIFLYIVLRFRSVGYGLGATIALIHDVLVVLSVFAIIDGFMPFATEFDQHLIAALLTLLGYSINDTVIVFDRIREFLNVHQKNTKDTKSIINDALNNTLNRTIITSLTIFMVTLVLFIFGNYLKMYHPNLFQISKNKNR
jgi:SecD/SecF fusion protein